MSRLRECAQSVVDATPDSQEWRDAMDALSDLLGAFVDVEGASIIIAALDDERTAAAEKETAA